MGGTMGKDLESTMCPMWLGKKALREWMGKTVDQSGRNGREQRVHEEKDRQVREGDGQPRERCMNTHVETSLLSKLIY